MAITRTTTCRSAPYRAKVTKNFSVMRTTGANRSSRLSRSRTRTQVRCQSRKRTSRSRASAPNGSRIRPGRSSRWATNTEATRLSETRAMKPVSRSANTEAALRTPSRLRCITSTMRYESPPMFEGRKMLKKPPIR